MEKPLKIKSLMASRKPPWSGGASLITSQATFHEYLIFLMSSQFNNSPGAFDLAISICSEERQKEGIKMMFSQDYCSNIY